MKQLHYLLILAFFSLFLLTGPVNAQNEGRGKDKNKEKNDQSENHPGQGRNKFKLKKNKAGEDTSQEGEKKDKKVKQKAGKEDIPKEKRTGKAENKNNQDRAEKQKSGKEKITICHKPAANGNNGINITISERAWKAHQAHGDTRGVCPGNVTSTGVAAPSERLVKKQTVFYEKVTEADEKVYDTEELLEVARERMRKARERLETARRTGKLPAPEIQKQETAIIRTASLIEELESLVQSTRQKIRTDVERVEVNLLAD